MKRILIFLILALPFVGGAQTAAWTAKTIPGSYTKAYGCANGGFQVAFMEVMHQFVKDERASNKVGKRKFPLIIFLHGIGERSGSATSARGNPATLADLFTTNLMSGLQYTTSSLYVYTFKNPDGSREYPIWWAPQCWGGHSFFYPTYIEAMLDYAEDEYSDIIDFDRVYLTGLSFGGGGTMIAAQYHPVSRRLTAIAPNVSGYYTYNTGTSCQFPDHLNFAEIKANKIPVFANHDQADATTGGSGVTDNFVRRLLEVKHSSPIIYTAFNNSPMTDDHRIWNYMYSTGNWNTQFTLRNGTTHYFGGTNGKNFVDWFLQFSRPPRPE